MTGNWFDDVAKTLAGGSSRRSFFKRFSLAATGFILAARQPAAAQGTVTCAEYCMALGYRGQAFGECVSSCETGEVFGAYACEGDSECFHTGCSGQICASEDIPTTCEYRCEYGCYAQAQCVCIGGRKCGFLMTQELHECLRACPG